MSIAHLQSYFATRTGREILPEEWPMDILISLIRELALLDEGKLEHSEVHQMRACMRDLVERLLALQPESRLLHFRESEAAILQGLVVELDKIVRNELVGRLIEYRSTRVEFEEAFEVHFQK